MFLKILDCQDRVKLLLYGYRWFIVNGVLNEFGRIDIMVQPYYNMGTGVFVTFLNP